MNARVSERDRYAQAAEWLLKVQAEGAPAEAFAEMLAWCDADPENKLAMEKIEEAWALTGDLTADSLAPEQGPRAHSLSLERGSRRFAEWSRDRFGRYGGWVMAGAVASVVLAIAAVAFNGSLQGVSRGAGERIATQRGTHETAALADGSTVALGGKSSVSVLYSAQSRVVVADDGEAFYKVSKDPGRPFIVRAGPVTVTAVGTAFSVRRAGESVSVVVTEGAVDVKVDGGAAVKLAAVRAEAGQRVRYDRGELTQSAESAVSEIAMAWQEGRLQFVDEPLRLVVASVNRYSEREIVIADHATEELRFTGTVFEKGVDGWLQGVATVFPIRIIELDKRRVMIAPGQS